MAGSIVNKLSRLNPGNFCDPGSFSSPLLWSYIAYCALVSFRFLVKCANSTLGFEIQDYFIFHIIFPNADIKIVPLRSILSNPDEYYCSEAESSILGAIIHPRYIRTDSFSETQKSATFFPFSFSPHRFIPDPPIQFSLTFLAIFYTDIFYSSIPIFIHCSRSRTVPILNQTRSPINRRSCEFASRLKKERTTYILNDGWYLSDLIFPPWIYDFIYHRSSNDRILNIEITLQELKI